MKRMQELNMPDTYMSLRGRNRWVPRVALAALTFFALSGEAAEQPAPDPAAAATNAFALDLYQQLAAGRDNAGRNLWFSPYSITSALAMTAEGASGNTLAEMARTLRFGEVTRTSQLLPIHAGMAALNRQFNAADAPASTAPPPVPASGRGQVEPQAPWQLTVANALWGDQRYPFDPKFVDTIGQYYGTAGVFPVDFLRAAESARSRINTWIDEQTRHKITDLLPRGSVDPMTRLVLTNAVYFKGSWYTPFNASATSPQPFHLEGDRTVSVPLMRGNPATGYMENDQLQAISMPFRGRTAARDMSMIVVLPKRVDGLAEVEKSLTTANLDAWIGALAGRPVQVFLPRFKMTNEVNLGRMLSAMGMRDAFDDHRADFSGISPVAIKDHLHISAVLHKAYLAVDENGAEAAATTAVLMLGGGRPQEPAVFRADHPFLVLLRHNPSGTILFMGRVMNPVAQ